MKQALFVLFVCEHNSARSQMAKTFLQDLGGDNFVVESCGIEAGKINPLVIEVMREQGYDIRENLTQSAIDLLKQGRSFDVIISVCSAEASKKCPVFLGKSVVLNWPFDDPSNIVGDHEEKLRIVRNIRDQIKNKIIYFIDEYKNKGVSLFTVDGDDVKN